MRKTLLGLGLALGLLLGACAPTATTGFSPMEPLGAKGEVDQILRFTLGPLIAHDVEALAGQRPEIGYTPEVARCLYGSLAPKRPLDAVRWSERAKAFREQGVGLTAFEGHSQALLTKQGEVLAFVRARPFSGGRERSLALSIRLVPAPQPMPWGGFCLETSPGFPRLEEPETRYPDLLALYRAAYEGAFDR